MEKAKGFQMFFTLYVFILMVQSCGYAGEIPKDFFIPRVNIVRSHLTSPTQNTARFAAAAMVLGYFNDEKIHPRTLEKYSNELRSVAGAAKVFKKLLGHGWYADNMMRQEVWHALYQKYPLFFEWDHGSFVTLVGYNEHGFFINDPDNPIHTFLYYDEIKFVSPFNYRVATGDPMKQVWIGKGNHL